MMDDLFDLVEDRPDNQIYTLSGLIGHLQAVMRFAFPGPVWIRSEIARMNIYPGSGHCYLDLVEKEAGKTKAQLRGIIWSGDLEPIAAKFRNIIKEELRAGISVLFLVRMNMNPVYGFSLVISDVEPSFTLGELARERLQTIATLKKEGLFDANRKIPVPRVPLRIGVISAETSKGFSDFITILKKHPRKYSLDVNLFPALLQGDKAVDSIIRQLKSIESSAERFDIVAIIRGGGDEIGMTCFDSYDMVREICLFPIPVLTGIGHSTNETVAEMVAAQNKITPTDVAYYILGLLDNSFDELEFISRRISDISGRRIRDERKNLELAERMLLMHKGMFFRQAMSTLDNFGIRLKNLDPKNVLKRGYSITRMEDGTVITDSSAVPSGKLIVTELFSGELKSRVESNEELKIKN